MPGAIEVSGAAEANAAVTINGNPAQRQDEYFRHELLADNSTGATSVWLTANATNATATNLVARLEHLPQTPESFTYDADGNLTSDGLRTYTWDAENRLLAVEIRTNIVTDARHWLRVTFDYDHQHRRVRKRTWKWNPAGETYYLSTSHRFFYDDWNLIGQIDEVIGDRMSFLWGADVSGSLRGAGGVGGLVAVVVHRGVQPGSYFSNYDHNGNVVALIDSESGSETARYEYGPFGDLLRSTGPSAQENSIRFSSKYYDEETGLSYYGYRYYSASFGRWLSKDPLSELGGLNLYGFAHNSPIAHFDSDGRFVLSLTMLVIDAGSAISHGLQGDYRAMARDLAFTVLDAVTLAADLGTGGTVGTAAQGARLALTAIMIKNSAGLIALAAHLIPDTVHSSGFREPCERDPHPLDSSSPLYPHPEGKNESSALDLDHRYSQTAFPNLRNSSENLDLKPLVENRGPKARWEKELIQWEKLAREQGMTESQIRQVTQQEWDSIARTVHPTTHPNLDGLLPK